MSGWISLYRKLSDNEIWREPRVFSKAEAWIDILWEVQYSHIPQEVIFGNIVIICNRGESLNSLSTWATRWRWSIGKVRRVLNLFCRLKMIEIKNERKTTRLTVLNYDTYQGQRIANETQTKRKWYTDNKVNKENKKPLTEKNGLFDSICKIFNLDPVTKPEIDRVMRVSSDLLLKSASENDIKTTYSLYHRKWPNASCSPEALLKHWDQLNNGQPKPTNTATVPRNAADVVREWRRGNKGVFEGYFLQGHRLEAREGNVEADGEVILTKERIEKGDYE